MFLVSLAPLFVNPLKYITPLATYILLRTGQKTLTHIRWAWILGQSHFAHFTAKAVERPQTNVQMNVPDFKEHMQQVIIQSLTTQGNSSCCSWCTPTPFWKVWDTVWLGDLTLTPANSPMGFWLRTVNFQTGNAIYRVPVFKLNFRWEGVIFL